MFKTKIFIAGHKGMVGSALVNLLKTQDIELITKDRKDGTYTIKCTNVQVGDKLWHYTNRYIVIYAENNNAQIRAYIPNFT